jgi:hypothetical protein
MSRADAIAALTYLIPHWRKGQGQAATMTSHGFSTDLPPLFIPAPGLAHRPPRSIDLCRRLSGGANRADSARVSKAIRFGEAGGESRSMKALIRSANAFVPFWILSFWIPVAPEIKIEAPN